MGVAGWKAARMERERDGGSLLLEIIGICKESTLPIVPAPTQVGFPIGCLALHVNLGVARRNLAGKKARGLKDQRTLGVGMGSLCSL